MDPVPWAIIPEAVAVATGIDISVVDEAMTDAMVV
jgi:hypothetical protein